MRSWQLRPQNRILPDFFSFSNAALTSGSLSKRNLAAADAVQVVAVDVVGSQPLQARVQDASRKWRNAFEPPTLPPLFLVTR